MPLTRLTVIPLTGDPVEVIPSGYDRVWTDKVRPKDTPYQKVFHWAYLAHVRDVDPKPPFDEWLRGIADVEIAETVDPTRTEPGDDLSPL